MVWAEDCPWPDEQVRERKYIVQTQASYNNDQNQKRGFTDRLHEINQEEKRLKTTNNHF